MKKFVEEVEVRGYKTGVALLSAQTPEERRRYLELLDENPANPEYQI